MPFFLSHAAANDILDLIKNIFYNILLLHTEAGIAKKKGGDAYMPMIMFFVIACPFVGAMLAAADWLLIRGNPNWEQ